MNKNQLIEAGMALALDCDQSAPQGLPAGRHARPAGSPASLTEKAATHGSMGAARAWQAAKPEPPRTSLPTGGAPVPTWVTNKIEGVSDAPSVLSSYPHYFSRAFTPWRGSQGPREDWVDAGLRYKAREQGIMGGLAGTAAAALSGGPIVAGAAAIPGLKYGLGAVGAGGLLTFGGLGANALWNKGEQATRGPDPRIKALAGVSPEYRQALLDAAPGARKAEFDLGEGDAYYQRLLNSGLTKEQAAMAAWKNLEATWHAGQDAYPKAQQPTPGVAPPTEAAPQQPTPPSPAMQAGAAAAQALPPEAAPAAPTTPAAPAAAPVAPVAPGAETAPAAPETVPGAPTGQEAAPGAAPAPQMSPDVAGLIWEGPVGDDAYQRALQNPMDMEQVNALTDAVNSGQIPQEQVPRVVQQIIAHDSIDKAMQEANKTGEPIEQVLGRIAQQRAQGEFDAEDLTRVVPMLERQAAEEDVAQRQQAGDQTANVEEQMQQNRQDPSLIDRLGTMWSGMDTGEKIGLVVGIIGSVVALANGLMGGNGMTTIMAGALGLGGLAYAFGGGDMIKQWFGGDQQAAGPKAPESSKSTPVPTGEGAAIGGGVEPLAGPDAEAAVPNIPGSDQQVAAGNQALEKILADGQVTMEELTSNADVLRGMDASRLVPLIQAAPPELQNQLSFLSKMGPEALGAAVQWAVQQSGGKLTPEDIYKMLEAYKLAGPQAA